MNAGLPTFVLSPGKWVEQTNAIGIYTKHGKYGGTLSYMESINALLIQQGLMQKERIFQLNKVAITQMKSLVENHSIKKLKESSQINKPDK
jgi:hypothetical protein